MTTDGLVRRVAVHQAVRPGARVWLDGADGVGLIEPVGADPGSGGWGRGGRCA
ncbi:hypothetical protein [Kutzneria sp. CA-103260]|uniref:hypothetical protein n=1 Tax=Kutzneria sp. CA-103260 TaxID=2802641 RepID=UPI001BAD4306|nr:hypothetical protein [Kutzneria sp. CA-103260]